MPETPTNQTDVLTGYFQRLLDSVQESDEVSNGGKDKDGFYFPTRSALIQKLNMLKDLNANVRARPMLISAWDFVVENTPAELLAMNDEQKLALKAMLGRKD